MGNWAEAPFKSVSKKKKWNFREPLGHTTSIRRLPDNQPNFVRLGGCRRVVPRLIIIGLGKKALHLVLNSASFSSLRV